MNTKSKATTKTKSNTKTSTNGNMPKNPKSYRTTGIMLLFSGLFWLVISTAVSQAIKDADTELNVSVSLITLGSGILFTLPLMVLSIFCYRRKRWAAMSALILSIISGVGMFLFSISQDNILGGFWVALWNLFLAIAAAKAIQK